MRTRIVNASTPTGFLIEWLNSRTKRTNSLVGNDELDGILTALIGDVDDHDATRFLIVSMFGVIGSICKR